MPESDRQNEILGLYWRAISSIGRYSTLLHFGQLLVNVALHQAHALALFHE